MCAASDGEIKAVDDNSNCPTDLRASDPLAGRSQTSTQV